MNTNLYNPFQRQKQEERRQFSKPTTSLPQVASYQDNQPRNFAKEARTIESFYRETDFRDLNIWKSHPRDWEDMGKLEKVFSILNRGQHMAANVVAAILHGDGDIAAAAWRGLTGEERGDFVDLLRYNDIPWAPVLGTILNIGLDPTTYLPGPITLIKRASVTVGQTKAVQQAIEMVTESNVYKMLDNMFNVHAGIPKILGENKYFQLYRLNYEQHNLAKNIEKMFNETPLEVKKLIFKHITEGTIPTSAKELELYTKSMEMMAEFTKMAVDLDIITPDAIENLQYMPVIARKWIKEGWITGQNVLGPARTSVFALPKKTKLTTETLREFSDTFYELSKLDSLAEMFSLARQLADDPSHPATEQLVDVIRDLAASRKSGNIKWIKDMLKKQAIGWEPVDDIQSVLILYGADLVRHSNINAFKEYVLRSADATGWAQKYIPGQALPDGMQIWAEMDDLLPKIKRIEKTLKEQGSFNGISKESLQPVLNWLRGVADSGITEPAIRGGPQKIFADMFKIPDSRRQWADLLSLADPSLPFYALDKGVADHLAKVNELFTGGKQANALLQLHDKALGKWKKWTTVMRLPFHMRNFISNTTQAYMAGVNPLEMPKLMAISAKIQAGSAEKITIGGITKTGAEWLEEMSVRGVRGFGFTSDAISKKYLDDYLEILQGTKPQSAFQKALEWPENVMRTMGGVIEDNARIMVALDRLGKNAEIGDLGLRLNDAAKHAWKYLYQYDQVTAFEHGVMKRVFPFYTWLRKNIPRQVGNILEQPGRFSKMSKVYNTVRYLDTSQAENEKFLPEYMTDAGYWKLPENITKWFAKVIGAKEPKNMYVHIDLPWGDLVNMTEPVKTMLNSLSPMALPLQLGLNSKSFPEPGTPIERFRGELRPAPWPVTWFPTGVWPLLGIQPMRDRKTGKQILGMPAKAVFTIENLFPVVSELTKLNPQVAELEAEDAPWRKLRYLTGVNFTPINFEQQKYYYALEQQGKLADAGRLVAQLGRGLTSDELKRLLRM